MANITEKENADKTSVGNLEPRAAAVVKSTKFWHIEKETLAFKLHFFLFEGGLSAVFLYITVFAQLRIGISASSLALALTVQQFSFIFTKILISYIADYLNKLKQIIIFLTIIQAICVFLLLPIPPISIKIGNKTEFNESRICRKVTHENASIPCSSSDLNRPLYITRKECCTLGLSKENDNISHNLTWTNMCISFSSLFVNSNISSCMCYMCNKYFSICNSTVMDFSCDECCISHTKPKSTITLKNSSEILNSTCCLIQNTTVNKNEYIFECYNCSFAFDQNSSSVQDNSSSVRNCKIKWMVGKNEETKISLNDINRSMLKTYQFWLFLLILLVAGSCVNALFTLSDTACYETVQKTGGDFGQLRVWGAIGWGSIAPFAGFLNDYTGDYVAAWCVMAIMCTADICIISRIDLVKPEFSHGILQDVGTLFKSKEFFFFELGVLMSGIGTGIVWFYLIWFLTKIGGSRLLVGLTQTVQCVVGEVPFMFFSGWIIKRVGHTTILTLALMGYTVRFFWYSYLYNPWLVLPVESMNGVTYGLFYAGVTAFGKLSAKPGTEATTQAVLFSTHEALGAGLGCVIGGVGFDYLGAHRTFFFAGIFSGCGMLLNIGFTIFLRRQKRVINFTSDVTP